MADPITWDPVAANGTDWPAGELITRSAQTAMQAAVLASWDAANVSGTFPLSAIDFTKPILQSWFEGLQEAIDTTRAHVGLPLWTWLQLTRPILMSVRCFSELRRAIPRRVVQTLSGTDRFIMLQQGYRRADSSTDNPDFCTWPPSAAATPYVLFNVGARCLTDSFRDDDKCHTWLHRSASYYKSSGSEYSATYKFSDLADLEHASIVATTLGFTSYDPTTISYRMMADDTYADTSALFDAIGIAPVVATLDPGTIAETRNVEACDLTGFATDSVLCAALSTEAATPAELRANDVELWYGLNPWPRNT